MNVWKIYRCNICGNIVLSLEDSGVTPHCCAKPMELMTVNTMESRYEKHLPVVNVSGTTVTVRVGEEDHPMEKEHYIRWILLETDRRVEVYELNPGDEPAAEFRLCCGECVVSVGAFCNIHGLWVREDAAMSL